MDGGAAPPPHACPNELEQIQKSSAIFIFSHDLFKLRPRRWMGPPPSHGWGHRPPVDGAAASPLELMLLLMQYCDNAFAKTMCLKRGQHRGQGRRRHAKCLLLYSFLNVRCLVLQRSFSPPATVAPVASVPSPSCWQPRPTRLLDKPQKKAASGKRRQQCSQSHTPP